MPKLDSACVTHPSTHVCSACTSFQRTTNHPTTLVHTQVELHPLLAQRKLLGVSYRKGVVSVAHSCLVRQSPEVQDNPLVQQVAAETGKTINQV